MHVLFICAEDGERMSLVSGKFGLFYRCPRHCYPKEAKKTGRKSCNGRLTLGAAELIEQAAERLWKQGRLDGDREILIRLDKCDVWLKKRSEMICEAVVKRKNNAVGKGGTSRQAGRMAGNEGN